MPIRDPVDYFEQIAPRYATRYGPGGGVWHRSFFEGRARIALRWLERVAGGRVADVGAGPGPLTQVLRPPQSALA